MSITFTFASRTDTGEIYLGADHTHHNTCTDPSCEDAAMYGWCDHTAAAEAACGCRDHDVNMSNSNAAMVIERLGLEFDYAGTIDPDDLLGRAMVANIGRDDSGTTPQTDRGAGGAVIIECGLRPGYFDGRMAALAALATEAKRRGALVGWS